MQGTLLGLDQKFPIAILELLEPFHHGSVHDRSFAFHFADFASSTSYRQVFLPIVTALNTNFKIIRLDSNDENEITKFTQE